MSNYVKFDVSIEDDCINITVSNTSLPIHVKTVPKRTHRDNYVFKNTIDASDDIVSILHNYIWYRGFIGLPNKYGRVFKELKLFDIDAKTKYGDINTLFFMLNLNSDRCCSNFSNFVTLQKTIFKHTVTVYNCIEMIGLCALVAEQWKNNNKCLNWRIVVDEMFRFIDPDMLEKIRTVLQERLAYEDLS
ncbi:m139R [Myxoma virus]|nr:m139R [Myxoma virus]